MEPMETTTQETAAEVFARTAGAHIEGGELPLSVASDAIDALAAAGWSVVRVQQVTADDSVSDVGGCLWTDGPDGLAGVPLYRVTAGEVAPEA